MKRDTKTKILALLALFAILFSVISTGILILMQTFTSEPQTPVFDVQNLSSTGILVPEETTGTGSK